MASTLTILLWLRFSCCSHGVNSNEQSMVDSWLYVKSADRKSVQMKPLLLSPPQCEIISFTDSILRTQAISWRWARICWMPLICPISTRCTSSRWRFRNLEISISPSNGSSLWNCVTHSVLVFCTKSWMNCRSRKTSDFELFGLTTWKDCGAHISFWSAIRLNESLRARRSWPVNERTVNYVSNDVVYAIAYLTM